MLKNPEFLDNIAQYFTCCTYTLSMYIKISLIITIDVWWSLHVAFKVWRKWLFNAASTSFLTLDSRCWVTTSLKPMYKGLILIRQQSRLNRCILEPCLKQIPPYINLCYLPEYNLSPCLCNTIVYAFRYSSSKLNPELFFRWISWNPINWLNLS